MSRPIVQGATDQSTVVRIVDATTGAPETGVVAATAGLALYYRREGGARTALSALSDLAAVDSAHSDGGLKHIGDGYYRVDPQDAAWAASAHGVLIEGTATDMVVIGAYHPLVAVNPYDSVRGGMTALPNAAAEAAGGLYTRGTGAGQIEQPSNGLVNVNLHRWLTGTPNALQTGRVDSYLGAVAAGVIAAGSFAAGALDAVWSTGTRTLTSFGTLVADVWSYATRVLTAATNVTSDGAPAPSSTDYTAGRAAKLDNLDATVSSRLASAGYTPPLDAAGTRAAVGLSSANLDTQLAELAAYIDTEVNAILAGVAAVQAKTDNLPASPAASGEAEAALASTARAELGAVPAANASLAAKLEYVFMLARNGGTQTATARTARNNAGTTIATQAVSDDGTTLTIGKAA